MAFRTGVWVQVGVRGLERLHPQPQPKGLGFRLGFKDSLGIVGCRPFVLAIFEESPLRTQSEVLVATLGFRVLGVEGLGLIIS